MDSIEARVQHLEDVNRELITTLKIVLDRYAPMPNKFSVAEAAIYLGMSVAYVYKFEKEGLLRTMSRGYKESHWFTREELDRFILEELPNYNYGKASAKQHALEVVGRKQRLQKKEAAA